MPRSFLVVMDSVGLGGARDSGAFFNDERPDTGANTLLHIAQACANGQCEQGRSGPLSLPNLNGLGLGAALMHAAKEQAPNLAPEPTGIYGVGHEISNGKDTPSGHWELTGVPVPWNWHMFPKERPTFPKSLTDAICKATGSNRILGNCHASGTKIIAEYGQEHIQTGDPICYTSSDSVIQIAAHEEHFGLERLLDLCRKIAPLAHAMKVGRVIARPFLGSDPGSFKRTKNRKDFAIAPPAPTLCDFVQDAGGSVHAIGKIGDIFSMQGMSDVQTGRDHELMKHLKARIKTAKDGSLTFANFVEFDSEYGHRRDPAGYARHLEWFDSHIGELISGLAHDDLLIITADHGNDPTWSGTDHTRETIPILVYHKTRTPRALGDLSFCDVAASIADHLNIHYTAQGTSFL